MRRRHSGKEEDLPEGATLLNMGSRSGGGSRLPTAQELLQRDPIKSGYMSKRSEQYFGACPLCCPARWKQRYFVLSGAYLFRYASEHGTSPKGVPLPLEACTFQASDGVDAQAETPFCIAVTTVRKAYLFQLDSKGERDEWLRVLRDSKQRVIKERLGHAEVNPLHALANRTGETLFNKRLKKDAEPQTSGFEMSSLYHGMSAPPE
mmetsp:Transcript_25477/g.74264  ORF Transcript_25477/g.74264 Transcript_25477/m.74264 type:complete len:206 (-) Transcript_25477:46-663(-)